MKLTEITFSATKHNPLVLYLYRRYLDWRCRNVQAYIFVATTGRSGSRSLHQIFSQVEDCASRHEPFPIMRNLHPAGTDVRQHLKRVFDASKVPHIKSAAAGHNYYVETNHMFIKNFAEHAIRSFKDKIKIIHLVRDPLSVASSMYSLGHIPGRPGIGADYLIDPTDDGNLLNVSDWFEPGAAFDHDYYRCLWYWYEIESRIKQLKLAHRDVPFFKIRTEELNKREKLEEMFAALQALVSEERVRKMVGTRSNLKKSEKKEAIELSEAEAMSKDFVNHLEKRFSSDVWDA